MKKLTPTFRKHPIFETPQDIFANNFQKLDFSWYQAIKSKNVTNTVQILNIRSSGKTSQQLKILSKKVTKHEFMTVLLV